MTVNRWTYVLAGALLLAGALALVKPAPAPANAAQAQFAERPDSARAQDGTWMTRTVWACDRRKAVIVEGVRPDEKLPPAKAQFVADLLMDLMRHCNEEIVARVGVDELIRVSVNGNAYQDYVIGGELPIRLAHNQQEHTRREQLIWKTELDNLVAEGDRLFHSDEIGKNGLACAMCHPNASNTHPETYPKFQTQLKKVALLRHMINWCIENPLEGPPLAEDDPKMIALEAYILSTREGVPIQVGKH